MEGVRSAAAEIARRDDRGRGRRVDDFKEAVVVEVVGVGEPGLHVGRGITGRIKADDLRISRRSRMRCEESRDRRHVVNRDRFLRDGAEPSGVVGDAQSDVHRSRTIKRSGREREAGAGGVRAEAVAAVVGIPFVRDAVVSRSRIAGDEEEIDAPFVDGRPRPGS